MKFADLHIQTQREAPNNARTEGFAFLVRAGYLNRENELLPLGVEAVSRIADYAKNAEFLPRVLPQSLNNNNDIYFPILGGVVEVLHCASCGYVEQIEAAQFKKTLLPPEAELPLEKISTPECNTIESLAAFLDTPKEKTAKALMFTRLSDNQFVFVVIRGDMQMSAAKLKSLLGETRPATVDEIRAAGAIPGYASPVGLKSALIVVDDLVLQSKNLAAGANESGWHFVNSNCGRDYSAQIVADLAQADENFACAQCGNLLKRIDAIQLTARQIPDPKNILLALAESNHDEKGLAFPKSAAPFDVYLMHVPGKQVDTRAQADKIYNELQDAGIRILYDDRDERAGVKFNDADLIGCPVRITIGERALQNNAVEIKYRQSGESANVSLKELTDFVIAVVKSKS